MAIVKRSRIPVLGVNIDSITMQGALDLLDSFVKERRPHMVATANAEMVMVAQEDPELCSILNAADLVLADGAGVVWASSRLVRMLALPKFVLRVLLSAWTTR